MTLKLWDLNMENAPVATFSVHEHLRGRVRLSPAAVARSCLAIRVSRVSQHITEHATFVQAHRNEQALAAPAPCCPRILPDA
jgi:hypothetical protein